MSAPAFFRLALQRVALLLPVYALCRLLFLLWNKSAYAPFTLEQLLAAFINGARFDLSAIILTHILILPLWLLPGPWTRNRWLWRVELGLFALINLICVGANIADAEYVKFIGKRSAFDILLIHEDLLRQGVSVLSTYWYFCLLLLLAVALLAWMARPVRDLREPASWAGRVGWRLALVGLAVLGARGGFQFKPLHPMHAYSSARHELGLLTLNTPFNVIRTRPSRGVERQRFFDHDRDAIARLRQMTDLSRQPLGVAKDFNVVIILVESLGSEYVGAVNAFPGYTPFLDQLAKDSFFFKNNFANARRSIEGLPAVICGIPAIMQEPVITSDFSNNRFDCLPHVLARRGYSTYFLHGAHNGSMHFDTFSHIAGFEHFVGLNEYPNKDPENLDRYWGVLDEPMLQHATRVLDEARKPALVNVFTLSSHHPYYIPPKYAGKFPKGDLEIHESIGYADYSIEQFFKTARSKPWFNKTIFVITGDHTQKFYHPEYGSMIGTYRVPLFIYVPGLKKDPRLKASIDRVTQHIDVMPSVLDLLGVNLPDRLLVGQSVFDFNREGRAYNFHSPEYFYVTRSLFFKMRRDGGLFDVERNAGGFQLSPEGVNKAELEADVANLKASVHYLNEGLVRNNLYDWRQAL